MEELMTRFANLESAYVYFDWRSLVFLLEALIILWIGKFIFNMFAPYNLDEELTQKDNKALAVSYAGYLVGQAFIVLGVMMGPSSGLVQGLIGVAVWSLAGIVLLNISRIINDRLILKAFSNRKEIIEDKNVGVGAAQCGGYIGTALLIEAIVAGEQISWLASVVGVLVFFIVGQIVFIIFSLIYAKVVRYDLHAEMERDNAAAGLSFGLTLIAVGLILSKSVRDSASIPAFFAWFLIGLALILVARFLIDKMLLPGHKLDEEVSTDQNWGVALVEGAGAVMVAALLNASFA